MKEKHYLLNKLFWIFVLSLVSSLCLTQTSFAEDKISVEIISIEPVRADQWSVSWNACSLVEKIGQDFRITSDLEWESFHLDFILYKDQCITEILEHPIISVIDAKNPESIIISLDEPTPTTNEQKILITDILSTKIKGKYVAFFDVCAGNNRLIGPEILVSSDIEERQASIGSVIGINSCFGHSAEIYADSIDSIKVNFADIKGIDEISITEVAEMQKKLDKQDQEIKELKEEISTLKETLANKEETISKKDAVLMEQVKVLKDLAERISNTVYHSLEKLFQL